MAPLQFFSHWQQIRADLLAVLDKFNDEDLAFVPFAGSWPVGRIMLHIANAEEGWFRYAVRWELDRWPEPHQLKDYPTIEAIKSVLLTVHEQTEAYLRTLTEADLTQLVELPWGESAPLLWIIWHVVEHEIHHRGELSFVLGLLGREGLDV